MNNKQAKSVVASVFLTACMALMGSATQSTAFMVDAASQTGAVNTANTVKTVNGVASTNFGIENEEAYSWTETEFSTSDTTSASTNDYLKSAFEISDEGVAAGEKVFEMNYTVYRNTSNGAANANKHWGVGFGLGESDTKITSDENAAWLNFNSAHVAGSINSHLCVYYTREYTLNVVAVAGAEAGKGTVTLSYTCAHCKEALTVSATVNINGYFAFGSWGDVEEGKLFTVKNVSFSGNTTEGVKTVSGVKTDFEVVNTSVTDVYNWTNSNFEATNTASAAQNPILKSKFAITDEDIATGEKVFEMNYATKSSNTNGNTANRWGIGFGLSETDVTINANKAIGFDTKTFYIYGTSYGSHLCNFHKEWRTMKLVGYAGGTLEVSWLCSYCNEWQTFTVEGIDFNGYFAFGSWGTVEAGKTYRMVDFTFEGNVAGYTLENGFEMLGASVRLSTENSGLRFTAQALSSTIEELNKLGNVEYGIIYKDTAGLGANVLTLENYETLGAGMRVFSSNVYTQTIDGVEYSTFNFAFYNIPVEAYTTERTVRFFAKVETATGETYVFYSDMISRSINYVATCAYNDVKTAEEYAGLSVEDKAVYQYELVDGTYSRYSEAHRQILLQYLNNTNA